MGRKKSWCDLVRVLPKICVPNQSSKKRELESKKIENNDRRRTSNWNDKLVICVFAVKHTLSDAWHNKQLSVFFSSTSQTISLAGARSWVGAPKKTSSRWRCVTENNVKKDDSRSFWNKTCQMTYHRLNRINTLIKETLCWLSIYCLLKKSNYVTTKT